MFFSSFFHPFWLQSEECRSRKYLLLQTKVTPVFIQHSQRSASGNTGITMENTALILDFSKDSRDLATTGAAMPVPKDLGSAEQLRVTETEHTKRLLQNWDRRA